MKSVVVRNIKRADAGVVKRLGALGASTVHEAYGRTGLMKPYLRPAWAGGEAAGTAVTVLAHPGDINELVDHLLFLDETPLPDRIQGSSGFTEIFETAGPRDRRGRSLRQFNLETRLMRYPCSYMIYSDAFNSLPSKMKDAIYRRMYEQLRKLSPADRKAVVEILRDTKPDLPVFFVSW